MQFFDLRAQHERYKPEIERRLQAVFAHGQFVMGPEVGELERELARYVGVAHAVTVKSGTLSLELALRALGVGSEDEVITVPFTWISTAEAIELVGARPVFVDIERATFTIDVTQIEPAITARTKAIIPVSLFGQMPDYAAINAIAARHGVTVIEDGAQSFGATQRGRRSSGVTRIGCTSFFPTKPLGCYGDGGALFTEDAELAAKIRAIRSHGSERPGEHRLVGVNGRLDTLQAAVLLAKLPHLDAELEQRQRLGARYSEALRSICCVPEVKRFNTHVYAQYTLRVPDRDTLRLRLKELGIPTAVYYPKSLHEQPVFRGRAELRRFPESEQASCEVLSLPMHPFLSNAEQDRVIAAVEKCLS
jgi:UDP-2-acetamido-2-deoxy-ribo-hexuluronate aminotransferase